MIRFIKKMAILIVSLTPSCCHYLYTGPWLYANHSSRGLDYWITLWVICIGLVILALAYEPGPAPAVKRPTKRYPHYRVDGTWYDGKSEE